MDFVEIIKKSKNKAAQINFLIYVGIGIKILYYSNINNIEDIKKYNINILNYEERDSYNYKIYFIEEVELYTEIFNILKKEKYEKIQIHSITKYKVYNNKDIKIYLSDNCGQEYLIIKKLKDIFIITKKRDESRCLLYVIRELIRISAENQKNIILHSGCIQTKKNNILILGDSGSGKTTLLFQLLDKCRAKFISNDRTIINEKLKVQTLPIKIRIGIQTIKNIESLHNFIKNKRV